jgi:hypothetical protein
MPKRDASHTVTCLDCHVECSAEDRCACCQSIERARAADDDPYAHLGSATAAGLRSMTPYQRASLTGRSEV